MYITKADGTQERFNPAKLGTSLRKAGATQKEIQTIVKEIVRTIKDGDQTHVIYKRAFTMLRDSEEPVAAKYSLRRALFNLGPTGFPFEDFLSRLFEAEGYQTRTRTVIKGKCASHEIDVAAFKPESSFVAEAKFHSRPGIKSDLQVAMYSYARFLDLKSHPICREDACGIDDLYVITNTKFTNAAIKYAECAGVNLLSWGYPKKNSLQQRIERSGLYPVTVLTTLSNKHKQALISSGIILCSDILKKPNVLKQIGVTYNKQHTILDEARALCG